jgi:hypothetical protein
MTMNGGSASPADARDLTDPGDQMQRNIRYQHAYGVILLLASVQSKLPYLSLWCEHHDDYLAERPDGLYDAFQIKSATPEDGDWVWSREGLKKSVKKFVTLNKRFPERIGNFNFVSNVCCLDSTAKDQIKRSPKRLLACLKEIGPIELRLHEAFSELCGYCECTHDDLRHVLNRMSLQVGPGRNSFFEEIAHRHLPAHTQCRSMKASELDACLDALMQVISRASSLDVRDPSKHWCAVAGDDRLDPVLGAKRVLVAAISTILDEMKGTPFQYTPVTLPLQIGQGGNYLTVLEKKLTRGGLSEFVGLVKQRAESAERHLLEMQAISPETFDAKLNQITSVVQGECDEARLDALSSVAGPYGTVMLRDVLSRLRRMADERPEMVHAEEYELLAGVAGLLTGECKVWWSEKFDMEAA